jgi:hypothetical protein
MSPFLSPPLFLVQVIIDVRNQPGMTEEIAMRGLRRAIGADNQGLGGPKIVSLRIIGKGFDLLLNR